MANEIQLISDGDGLAVIGDPTAVERFLAEFCRTRSVIRMIVRLATAMA